MADVRTVLYRPRGMSDAAFAEWSRRLLLVGDEAFLPEEVDGRAYIGCRPPIKTCQRCGRQYVRRSYGEHADQYHDDGPRTAYFREHARQRRDLDRSRADREEGAA